MSNLIIAAVPITLLPHMFPKAAPHLARVVEKAPDDLTLDTIEKNLLSGGQMLVTISDNDKVIAVNVLEVCVYQTGHRVMMIPITGGDLMDEWLERFMEIAHAIARDFKCDELRGMACRKGWLRTLKNLGWYSIHEVIGCKVKTLEENAQ